MSEVPEGPPASGRPEGKRRICACGILLAGATEPLAA